MKLSAIVALDLDAGIGLRGQMPWPRLPADLARFKAHTMGKPVLVGRRTWESIGRPLVGRHLIVVSRTLDASAAQAGVQIARDLPHALDLASQWGIEGVVAGGAVLYAALLDRCSELLVTVIHDRYGCDTFFPYGPFPGNVFAPGKVGWAERWETADIESRPADAHNPVDMEFVRLRRGA